MDETIKNDHLNYTGEKHKQPKPGQRDAKTGQILYPYLPGKELVEAVNLTIQLKRPLLIKGEPGCGKTRLAGAVAFELALPYEAWHVKSTSRARDGLYTYDAVGRLRDAQLAASRQIKKEELSRINYVRLGPLGCAFQNEQRTVVLIDEIDKADIDFPNDLLFELDEQRFDIEETKETFSAKAPPIIFITSNDEKDLPDAFLRRCLFHHVEFPKRDELIEIVQAHFAISPETVVGEIIDRFLQLRDTMTGKKVSTSELMDWVRVLQHYHQDEILAELRKKILYPYPSVLLKGSEDYRDYMARKLAEASS